MLIIIVLTHLQNGAFLEFFQLKKQCLLGVCVYVCVCRLYLLAWYVGIFDENCNRNAIFSPFNKLQMMEHGGLNAIVGRNESK